MLDGLMEACATPCPIAPFVLESCRAPPPLPDIEKQNYDKFMLLPDFRISPESCTSVMPSCRTFLSPFAKESGNYVSRMCGPQELSVRPKASVKPSSNPVCAFKAMTTCQDTSVQDQRTLQPQDLYEASYHDTETLIPRETLRGGIPGAVLEPLVRSWSHFVGIYRQKLTRSLAN